MKTVSVALLLGFATCAFVQPASAADAATYVEKVLYSFCGQKNCTDGEYPFDGLINANGTLYGTASGGGRGSCNGFGCGTVFSLNLSTGAEKTLYTFCSKPGCADGGVPTGLIDMNGTLYGTTSSGGTGFGGDNRYGTAFALDPATGAETVLYSFCQQQDCPDGAHATSLIAVNGTLYGTTETGGTGFYGTAFSLDPNTGTEKVVYSFCQQPNCADGSNPDPAMVNVNGVFYGTTLIGGGTGCSNAGCGTVYSINPNTGAEAVLYAFCSQPVCADGKIPRASLIDVGGMLYGTTYQGGGMGCNGMGCGTVFSIDPSNGAETVLHSFSGAADGANPYANLIDVKGTLYGTTSSGGGTGCSGAGCGTIFSVDPTTGTEKVLYSFCSRQNCTDGKEPVAGLIFVSGKFYGTTDAGGTYNSGTIFALKRKQ